MNIGQEYNRITKFPLRFIPLMLMATLTINILGLALPLTMKQIYSRVVVYQSRDTLLVLLFASAVALLLESIMRRTKDYSSKWISSKYEYLLTGNLANKLLNIQSSKQINFGTQSNLDRFKSVSAIASYYSKGFYQIFVDLPFVFLFLYLIYFLGGTLVIVPITMAVLYIGIMTINAKMYINRRKEQMDYNEEVMSHLNQSLVKIHLIKSSGIEEFAIAGFKNKIKKLTESEFRVKKLKMTPDNVGSYIIQLNLFATFFYGGYLIINGQADFGVIIASALLGGRAISPVVSTMKLYMQNSDVKTQKSRVEELALTKEQYDDNNPNFPEDINGTIELLSFTYYDIQENQENKLDGTIKAGSFVCIDPKEFLSYQVVLSTIVGKAPIDKGKILIDSMDISEWNMDSLKGKIEHLMESVPIFKGTIMENITLFDASKNRDVYEASALTGFDKLVTKMPKGFETQLDSQSRNSLQSSFIQRLGLTRALLYRPRILVIDRVDSSMDYETLEIFIWILTKLKGTVTIIIATNNKDIIELADTKLTREGIIGARG